MQWLILVCLVIVVVEGLTGANQPDMPENTPVTQSAPALIPERGGL